MRVFLSVCHISYCFICLCLFVCPCVRVSVCPCVRLSVCLFLALNDAKSGASQGAIQNITRVSRLDPEFPEVFPFPCLLPIYSDICLFIYYSDILLHCLTY